jgi:hypothetical protein
VNAIAKRGSFGFFSIKAIMLECRGVCEKRLMHSPFLSLFRLFFSALWRGSHVGPIPAVFAALLFLAPLIVGAQETEPPRPAPTVTPSPVSSQPADGEAGGHANLVILRYQFRPIPVPGWR